MCGRFSPKLVDSAGKSDLVQFIQPNVPDHGSNTPAPPCTGAVLCIFSDGRFQDSVFIREDKA
jgi:hypothetical protein